MHFFYQIKDELETTIKDKMNQQYGVNEDVTKSIDKLQQEVGSNKSPWSNVLKWKHWNAEYHVPLSLEDEDTGQAS